MLAWLSVWSEVQSCTWPSWSHCHSLSLASVKSRLVLPFWYRLTWVVPEKVPLNGCVCIVTYICGYSRYVCQVRSISDGRKVALCRTQSAVSCRLLPLPVLQWVQLMLLTYQVSAHSSVTAGAVRIEPALLSCWWKGFQRLADLSVHGMLFLSVARDHSECQCSREASFFQT